jgi:hypothetical protein
VVVIMLANRRASSQFLQTRWLLLLLLAIACGGEDKGRLVGDSYSTSKVPGAGGTQASTAPATVVLLQSGDFEGSTANGWGSTTDGSPKPTTAPRPIKATCPQDSKYDCCIPEDDPLWVNLGIDLQAKGLSLDKLAQLAPDELELELVQAALDAREANSERAVASAGLSQLTSDEQTNVQNEIQFVQEANLQHDYRCAPAGSSFCPSLSSSLATQAIDLTPDTAGSPSAVIGTSSGSTPDWPSGRALHIRAARFTDWGAQVYFSYKLNPTSNPWEYDGAFDASGYDGISMWVRLGHGGTQPVGRSLFIVFEDKFTKENQPKYAINESCTGEIWKLVESCRVKLAEQGCDYLESESCDAGETGNCNRCYALDGNGDYARDAKGDRILAYELDAQGHQIIDYVPDPEFPDKLATVKMAYDEQVEAKNCYDVPVDSQKCDRFGAGIGLEKQWRFVKIPFSAMRQRGYGLKSPAGRLLVEQLLGFGIYMDIGNWDFWIEKVAFYTDAQSD